MRKALVFVFSLSLLAVTGLSAQQGDREKPSEQEDPIPLEQVPPSPVLEPREALESFELPDGYEIQLAAAEPQVEDPVQIVFDGNGRMWVVEMRGYMPNVDGTGEDKPVGRIVVLGDTDNDGYFEKRVVFLDNLVMPRTISLVKGGVLIAEDPKLWFVENNNYEAGEKILVDDNYASGGNVEHKPNGLMPGLDNWLYNTKSNKRYRLIDGEWVEASTENRGQWGITMDDYGRLYYNHNSTVLQGDDFQPNFLMGNPHHKANTRTGRSRSDSNRVYPIRLNTGVNRGYRGNTLTDEGKLNNVTGACGPVVFRGNGLGEDFYGNAFVPEPTGNLVKRVVLEEENGRVRGRQAYDDMEFLASTDERFRPVNANTGPDGCLYIVDMYRGIIQHRTYMTTYLRRQVLDRDLDKPIGLGRIYRICKKSEGRGEMPRMLDETTEELVGHLDHPNGWWRDTAQRLIIERGDRSVVPLLEEVAGNADEPLAQIHALWTLEGLGGVTPQALSNAAKSENPKVLSALASVSTQLAGTPLNQAAVDVLKGLMDHPSWEVQVHLARVLGEFEGESLDLLATLMADKGGEDLFVDAALSGLTDKEAVFATLMASKGGVPGKFANALAEAAKRAGGDDRSAVAKVNLPESQMERYKRGEQLYLANCMGCHQLDGEGLQYVAPPLVDSEWVEGPESRLIHIVLNGVEGPITVRGKEYTVPEVPPLMPGLRHTPGLDDGKLAELMTYVRNAWGNSAAPVQEESVSRIREALKDREDPFTQEELLRLK